MYTDFNTLSLKLAISLLLIFGLMIMLFVILRRVKGGSLSIRKYQLLKNLGTLSLGPKKSLAVIEVSDQWFLVGVGSDNISLISKLDKPSDYDKFDNNFPREGNLFDSFLSKAGLSDKAPEAGSRKNEI